MVTKLGWAGALICCLAVCGQAQSARPKQAPKQDRGWKHYHNPQAGYCLSYPHRWFKGDAFDGTGIYIGTGVKRYSRPLGEIDVGILPPAPQNQPHTTAISLDENLQVHLDGLKTFERAQHMQVLEQRSIEFLGSPGLFTKDKYYDPLDRSTWIDEVIFVRRKDDIFRLELECRSDQLARFEAVFTQLLNSFEFDCRR